MEDFITKTFYKADQSDLNTAVDNFDEVYYKKLVLFLHNKRPGLKGSFDDFRIHLNKIQTPYIENSLSRSFKRFIKEKFNGDEWAHLYSYLKQNGLDKIEIENLEPNYDEKTFMNRLPKSNNLLYILISYLCSPRLTNKFFMDNPIFSLKEQEQQLISYFRELDPHKQEKFLQSLGISSH